MKKQLETDLKTLAEKILSEENGHNLQEMKNLALGIYENLCVQTYVEKNNSGKESYESDQNEADLFERRKWNKENKSEDRYAPDGTHYNPEGITEPNTEKIKDIVNEMPEEIPQLFNADKETTSFQNELRNLGVHYDDLPQFEPVQKKPTNNSTQNQPNNSAQNQSSNHQKISETEPASNWEVPLENVSDIQEKSSTNSSPIKKSLNDRLKKGISFGLNDRLVFIKHLFDGNASDYDRVLSQLNTFQTYHSAIEFLEDVVKPDYNYWKGEEIYEKRFLAGLETKMN